MKTKKLDGIDTPSNYQQVDVLEKEKDKEKEVVVKTLPKPPPFFSQRLKKKLTVNMPLIEALEQMPRYAKFMKDVVTKKRAKKADARAFTVPYTIGSLEFSKDFCDLEASINLMPLAVYKKLGLGDPTPTIM
ncbi:uncharacterized protein LOC124887698 [Capsicum annuum]|uniref:uncharacterized protein LOC124887698 n=1 Tax=Capsicum annuum TaxID=4072 RepID=UPI001FB06E30|nr:uncharacterized protein LOC124887698 [Capsicum annuum]